MVSSIRAMLFFFSSTTLFELITNVPKSSKVISLCGQLRDKGMENKLFEYTQ